MFISWIALKGEPDNLVLAIFFAVIAFLLIRKSKKDIARSAAKKSATYPQPVDPLTDTYTSNNPELPLTIITNHDPEFPKYPNEDTDIPGDTYIYDKTGNIICRADGVPLNDADAAYLVRAGYEKATNAENNSINPKFHRTAAEEELKFQFMYKYGDQSQNICDVFLNLANKAYLSDDYDKKFSLLEQCIKSYNTAKKWHYNKSKGAALWFQDNWEYCHNSKNECFSWIDDIYIYRNFITEAQNAIIPYILENAKKGFLQTEIYKVFPDVRQSELRDIISYLVKKGKISKNKKGNTYYISLPSTEMEYEAVN